MGYYFWKDFRVIVGVCGQYIEIYVRRMSWRTVEGREFGSFYIVKLPNA